MSASSPIRYLLRLPKELHEAVQESAERDHRSLNAQITYILERFIEEERQKTPAPKKVAA